MGSHSKRARKAREKQRAAAAKRAAAATKRAAAENRKRNIHAVSEADPEYVWVEPDDSDEVIASAIANGIALAATSDMDVTRSRAMRGKENLSKNACSILDEYAGRVRTANENQSTRSVDRTRLVGFGLAYAAYVTAAKAANVKYVSKERFRGVINSDPLACVQRDDDEQPGLTSEGDWEALRIRIVDLQKTYDTAFEIQHLTAFAVHVAAQRGTPFDPVPDHSWYKKRLLPRLRSWQARQTKTRPTDIKYAQAARNPETCQMFANILEDLRKVAPHLWEDESASRVWNLDESPTMYRSGHKQTTWLIPDKRFKRRKLNTCSFGIGLKDGQKRYIYIYILTMCVGCICDACGLARVRRLNLTCVSPCKKYTRVFIV